MDSFFSLVSRHGFKMGLATFLGYLITYTAYSIGLVIFVVMAFLLVAGTIGGMAGGVDNIEGFIENLAPGAVLGFGFLGIIAAILFYLGIILTSFMVEAFLSGGILGMAKEVLLENQARVGTFFSEGFRYLWRLTGQAILLSLLFMLGYFLLIFPTLLVPPDQLGPVGTIFAIAVILSFLFFAGIFFLHAPALLVREDLRVLESIRYTLKTVFTSFFSVFLSTLLFGLLFLAINILYFFLSILIVGFFALLQASVHEGFVVLTFLTGIPLGLLYFVIVLPMSFAVAHLLLLHRYEKRVRRPEFVQAAA